VTSKQYAIAMHTDLWKGVTCEETVVQSPSSEDISSAISALDASTRTMVTVLGPGQAHLTVGGGSGRFVVYATFDNETFFNLKAGRSAARAQVRLCIGGQEGDYPVDQVVDVDRAKRAATVFAESGTLSPELDWADG
jgi:hypothetical protein